GSPNRRSPDGGQPPTAAPATASHPKAPTATSQRRSAVPAKALRDRTATAASAVRAASGTSSLRRKAKAIPNLGQAVERFPPHRSGDLVNREAGPLVEAGQSLDGTRFEAHRHRRPGGELEGRLVRAAA